MKLNYVYCSSTTSLAEAKPARQLSLRSFFSFFCQSSIGYEEHMKDKLRNLSSAFKIHSKFYAICHRVAEEMSYANGAAGPSNRSYEIECN